MLPAHKMRHARLASQGNIAASYADVDVTEPPINIKGRAKKVGLEANLLRGGKPSASGHPEMRISGDEAALKKFLKALGYTAGDDVQIMASHAPNQEYIINEKGVISCAASGGNPSDLKKVETSTSQLRRCELALEQLGTAIESGTATGPYVKNVLTELNEIAARVKTIK